ncbi:MAG: phosphatase PAP2 family protein [Pseudomonadota bacterium]|nr:phosphatase PAP2 family protein [Pseudomonadota bacterium]
MSNTASLDYQIISHLNQASRKSWLFDQIVAFVSANNLLKGGIFMAFIWWAWFRDDGRRPQQRPFIVSTLLGCVVALALARMLALTLPFRLRPLHETTLDFLLPYGVAPGVLDGYSSFPSDHAVLFFSLATGLFFVSKIVGAIALGYAVVCIALPRIYLGLHYPTDIAAGALLGMAISWIANSTLARSRPMASVVNWSYSKPSFFYPLLFLITYQIADMFDSSRVLISGVVKALQQALAWA